MVTLSDLFDLSPKVSGGSKTYEFKGFIGFVGAHYVSYFRTLDSDVIFDLSLSEAL